VIRRDSIAIALATLMVASAPARAATFEYLYVESNVGGSSGGHAAILLGDRVFHYMNADDGSLRLLREPFDAFRYTYTVLENRTVHVGRIDISQASYERIRDRFNRRHLIEQQHFRALTSQREDAALLERIVAGHGERRVTTARPPDDPAILGAGFFDLEGPAPAVGAPTLRKLLARITSAYGPEMLARRLAATDRALSALRPDPVPAEGAKPSRDRMPPDETTFSERFVDLASARAALGVLMDARPVRRTTTRSGATADWELTPADRSVLEAFAESLEGRLAELFHSDRDDWGYAALVGMARLEAVTRSLASGRWIFLDVFPERTHVIADVAHPGRSEFFDELRRYSRSDFFATRAALASADEVGEREYSAVEVAANRALEIRDGIANGRDIRVFAGHLAPQGEASAPDAWLPRIDRATAEPALRAARMRVESTERGLRDVYAYELIENNCVSALFETLESAFADAEVAERLGGRVETRGTLNFIPWISFDAVKREYRVVEVGEIPSLRLTRMAAMYARENRARVYLRESNTLTSSIYRSNPHDSFFVFFTDDVVWPRPFYGAFNFLAGIGQATLGLLRMPFTGPEQFVAGVKGAFFSLPELFFVNLRKGSLDYGPSVVARTGHVSAVPTGGTPPVRNLLKPENTTLESLE